MARDLARAVADLDAWLEGMRQPGGYGGPVAHWWQDCLVYAGPGVDWRYEGILGGYALLWEKTGRREVRERLRRAAADVVAAQTADGAYRASQFERNPATLGTPHEAAATWGLLRARPHLEEPDAALAAARRNLEHLVERLADPGRVGFNDRPGVPGRVPNKLATFATALLALAEASGEEAWLGPAAAALDEVVRYQVRRGRLRGAVHQYGPGAARGDGRFFPYYNARCVPPLLAAERVLGGSRYGEAAAGILGFLRRSMESDGGWPQVIYASGARARSPRWIAGAADILLAFRASGEEPPGAALDRLLAGQLPSGGFDTGEGFADRSGRSRRGAALDWRDILPVVGWNDKVLRLLAELLPPEADLPPASTADVELPCTWSGRPAVFRETREAIAVTEARTGRPLYRWSKAEPWAEAGPGVRAG